MATTYAAGTTFSFTILNLYIRNPPTTKTTGAIIIYTAYLGSIIDYDSSVTFTATYANITSMTVSASNYQTNQDYITYYITVSPPGYLLTTAILNLTLPSEITVTNSRTLRSECCKDRLSGFNTYGLDCSVIDNNHILIRNGFERGVSADPPTLVFSISALKNPRSTAPTSNFTMDIYDESSTYKLFNVSTAVNISMT